MFMCTVNFQEEGIVCNVSQTTLTRALYVIKHICEIWVQKNTLKSTRLANCLRDLLYPLYLGPGNSEMKQTQPVAWLPIGQEENACA